MFQKAVKRFMRKGVKGVARDLAPACVLLFVSCFMLFLFEPVLMYATNVNDFWFDFQVMIWPVLGIFAMFFLAGVAAVVVIYTIDLSLTERHFLYKGTVLIGFAAFFLLYLQGNWLIGNLPPLTGEKIAWENYGKYENFVLISAAVILVAAMIISIRKQGFDRTVFYLTACSSVVFVMLSAALIPAMISSKILESKENDVFQSGLKNFNTVSSNKNFLIFLIDATDSQVCYDVMMQDDDFRGMMEDFTYYPDTLSVFPNTLYSMPNILSGTLYHNETRFRDYSSGAYNQSTLFENLTQNGYEINLYGNMIRWYGERNYNIENAVPISDTPIDLIRFMKIEIKYIMFKYLPYGFKQLSKEATINFEWCASLDSEYGTYSWESWGDRENYEYITGNSVLDKQSNNYFQFIHCEGSHPPFNLDKNLNTVEDGTYEQKLAAALTVIKAYLQRLKDNDAYDNSAIVIMSDHGAPYSGHVFQGPEGQDVSSAFNPILFIKGINEKHEMLESDRPVSYADLQDAFCDLIDGKQSTELFAGLEPGRTRTMLWYKITEEDYLFEYSTTGTAWETEKFTPTGTVYELEG